VQRDNKHPRDGDEFLKMAVHIPVQVSATSYPMARPTRHSPTRRRTG
jgi:hypothetical protein